MFHSRRALSLEPSFAELADTITSRVEISVDCAEYGCSLRLDLLNGGWSLPRLSTDAATYLVTNGYVPCPMKIWCKCKKMFDGRVTFRSNRYFYGKVYALTLNTFERQSRIWSTYVWLWNIHWIIFRWNAIHVFSVRIMQGLRVSFMREMLIFHRTTRLDGMNYINRKVI